MGSLGYSYNTAEVAGVFQVLFALKQMETRCELLRPLKLSN